FGGARQTPRQALVDRDVAAPQLRELEVRVGEGELEARRRRARDRGGLVLIGVWVERAGGRAVRLEEAGEHTGIADLVRDPHVRGAAGEDPGAAPDLGLLLAMQIVVEPQARRDQEVHSREAAAVVVHRRATRVAE